MTGASPPDVLAPMTPEPCDTAELAPASWGLGHQRARQRAGVSPCGRLDLLGQDAGTRPIRDIAVIGGLL